MKEEKKHCWTPGFDMESIPPEVMFSHAQSLAARKNFNGGRRRACGHTKWIMSCNCCKTNYKRTAYRISRGARTLADRIE